MCNKEYLYVQNLLYRCVNREWKQFENKFRKSYVTFLIMSESFCNVCWYTVFLYYNFKQTKANWTVHLNFCFSFNLFNKYCVNILVRNENIKYSSYCIWTSRKIIILIFLSNVVCYSTLYLDCTYFRTRYFVDSKVYTWIQKQNINQQVTNIVNFFHLFPNYKPSNFSLGFCIYQNKKNK